MNNNKPHLFYDLVENYKYYANPGHSGNNSMLNIKDRVQHGNKLLEQLNTALQKIEEVSSLATERTEDRILPLVTDKGIFLSVVSDRNTELDIEKFDNTSFKLKTLKSQEESQVLTFYTSQNKQDIFSKKIQEFLDEETNKGNPKNLKMLNNIFEIRPSTLEDLWTDDLEFLPTNNNTFVKCEVWISFSNEESEKNFKSEIKEGLLDYISKSYITLPTVTIFKAEAKRFQLEKLIAEYPDIVELRLSSENPSVFIDMDLPSQLDFTEDFNERIQLNENNNEIFVTVLDTGVNYNNNLLNKVCGPSYCTAWDSNWNHYTDSSISLFNVYHGSYQAGVAAFGTNILDKLISNELIEITHKIESGRILPPPPGKNPEELYGAITLDTINNLVIDRPDAKRVYSLAVTNREYSCEGYPTSWSAALDNFCYENSGIGSDVFIISAGNALNFQIDYWTNARAAKVQDPAQAWNAITVGSCTKLYDVSNITNPVICSQFEDINPTTSSSHSWEWSDAPFKPEILCEGGNRLVHADGTIDFHEDLSVLTASGKTQGNIFASHTDTSAATAEASYIAAKIISAYPDAKPETIRGLLIHSAEWSEPIFNELKKLASQHSKNNILQEYKRNILSVCGYGIPSLHKAVTSKNDRLTLIIESSIQPFNNDKYFTLKEFNLHDLPWPDKVLKELPLDSKVKMTVTLSYFIEPNPRVSSIKSKYVYRSHGLSFNLCKPGQDKKDFIESVSRKEQRSEDYTEHNFVHKWFFGSQLQGSGSIHKDFWEGSAAELSEVSRIVVKPVTGWWKLNRDKERCSKSVNYSLIVTLEVDDNEIDIYSEVEQKIKLLNQPPVKIDIKV